MVTPKLLKMSHLLGLHSTVEKECLAPRSPISIVKLMNIKVKFFLRIFVLDEEINRNLTVEFRFLQLVWRHL
jgi:hypothetical protein